MNLIQVGSLPATESLAFLLTICEAPEAIARTVALSICSLPLSSTSLLGVSVVASAIVCAAFFWGHFSYSDFVEWESMLLEGHSP